MPALPFQQGAGGLDEWLQVSSHGWTEADGRLASQGTAAAASNAADNEREICFHIGPFFCQLKKASGI